MRLKAKNFIAKQRENEEHEQQLKQEELAKQIDPNNYTCKFCNGSIDQKTMKFVHEKFCLVANKNSNVASQPITTEIINTKEAEKTKTQQKKVNKKITDCSTQGESEEGTHEEDK